jgi:sugar phosphate isomerase/epimerase
MRYGNCISHKDFSKIKILKTLGFDYIETGLSGLYASSPEEIANFIGALDENKITCEAVNVFFPGDIALVGENADFDRARDYVSEVCEKTKNIGFKIAVFGSGRSRYCPEGYNKDRAVEQIIKVTGEILAPAAEKYNFVIAIEELNRGETNTINTLSEAEYIANQVNHKNIKVLADIYHIAKEGETLANLKDAALLTHCHISNPITRKYPHSSDSPEEVSICKQFFADLRGINYNARISIEAGLGGLAVSDEPVPEFVDEANRTFYIECKYALEFMKTINV